MLEIYTRKEWGLLDQSTFIKKKYKDKSFLSHIVKIGLDIFLIITHISTFIKKTHQLVLVNNPKRGKKQTETINNRH